MAALAGIIDWSGRPVTTRELTTSGVVGVLGEHGDVEYWEGPVGPGAAAIAGFGKKTAPALVVIPDRLVVAGDIHLVNRPEVVAALGGSTAGSDLEIVASAYTRWGREFTSHISGWFALAIIDLRESSCLLVRDHIGRSPLVFSSKGDRLLFASNALALSGFEEVGNELDVDTMARLVVLGYGTDATVVKGVTWLSAGSMMDLRPGSARVSRWWCDFPVRTRNLGSIDAHAERLRSALEESVIGTMRDASNPGIFLSGGLDSPSIAAVAARAQPERILRTYTSVPPSDWSGYVPPGWVPDERKEIDALVRQHPNLHPTFLDVKYRKIETMFQIQESLWELGGSPVLNPFNASWIDALSEDAVADGVDLILDGGLGNVGFSADAENWLVDLLLRGRLVQFVREIDAWSEDRGISRLRTFRHNVMRMLVPPSTRAFVRRRIGKPDGLQSHLSATAINPEMLAALDTKAVLEPWARPDRRNWTRRPDRVINIVAAQSDYLAAAATYYGITRRDPLSERRLMEIAFEQPDMWRRHRGVTRAICRIAMKDDLPSEIVDRSERGIQLPDWYDRLTDSREQISQEVSAMRDHGPSREVLDVDRLERLVRNWPERSDTRRYRVVKDYQLALSRAIYISRYMRWFEARAERIRAGGPTSVVTRWWADEL